MLGFGRLKELNIESVNSRVCRELFVFKIY